MRWFNTSEERKLLKLVDTFNQTNPSPTNDSVTVQLDYVRGWADGQANCGVSPEQAMVNLHNMLFRERA